MDNIKRYDLVDLNIKEYILKFIENDSNNIHSKRYLKYDMRFTKRLKEFSCELPLLTDPLEQFGQDYFNWFNNTNKSYYKIIIEFDKGNNYWIVSTNSLNLGFHKYLVGGIIKLLYNYQKNYQTNYQKNQKVNSILNENENQFEEIPEEFCQYVSKEDLVERNLLKPLCYEWYFKDFQNQEVYKMITNRVDLKDYITLFKKYRIQFPKMSFLTFHVASIDSITFKRQIYNIPVDWLEIESNPILESKIAYFINRLLNKDEVLKDFTISITTVNDLPVRELLNDNDDLYKKVEFDKYGIDKQIWIQMLFAIGPFGINKLYEYMMLDNVIKILENHMNINNMNDDINRKIIKHKYGDTIKKLYKFSMMEPGLSKIDMNIYFKVVESINNQPDNIIHHRAKFCVYAERLIENINNGKYSKYEIKVKVARFKSTGQNKAFFTNYKEINEYLYKYVHQLEVMTSR